MRVVFAFLSRFRGNPAPWAELNARDNPAAFWRGCFGGMSPKLEVPRVKAVGLHNHPVPETQKNFDKFLNP